MSLEQEIKQTKPFKSNYEKTLVNIFYTNNWIHFKQNKYLKPFDISIQQYNVLRILNGQKDQPITINEIIDRMIDKMSNASRLVDKLFAKGYVSRDQKVGNRRACDVKITPKGTEFLGDVTKAIKGIENDMNSLTEAEFDELNRLLDKLRN
ncbi:MarR family transcriptional regulator [Lacihabitans sp. CCS-44]|uniref:MarR family winged helix-turn-helix transcriptional regulator n=1 Tax=Lacihabitans sp. CCS-44 TaxID=2487331 RepID=UPI0020CCCF96|nr:MarR family transcriptional regulator [Lacihabitans sp. CCS-44]MCP9754290.1 MarR family transcriptional regulator [Lacihabitans sp. CCS-44]